MDINKNKELFLQQLFENNYKVDAFPMKFLKTYLGQQKYVRNKKGYNQRHAWLAQQPQQQP